MSTPFDLHVLSTPPAFILSQDQTLNKMVSKEPKFFKSSYRSLIHSFKEIKSRAFFQALLVRRTSRPFWCFVFLSRCLIYKVHAPVSRSADVLFILALPDSFVKNFFQVFSELFSSNPLISVLFKLVLVSRLELAHFITHTRVCQALFSELFQKAVRVPLGFFRFWSDFHALSQGAQIEYHPQPHLSTPFFSFSSTFFSPWKIPHIRWLSLSFFHKISPLIPFLCTI